MSANERMQEIIDELGKRGFHVIEGGLVPLGDPTTLEEKTLINEFAALVAENAPKAGEKTT